MYSELFSNNCKTYSQSRNRPDSLAFVLHLSDGLATNIQKAIIAAARVRTLTYTFIGSVAIATPFNL